MHSRHSEPPQPPRKGPAPQSTQNKTGPSRPISPLLISLVEKRVRELHADRCPKEYSAVIAKEFGISEALADRIMTGLIIELGAEAATLRSGICGALDEATRARRAVWEVA
jgi:hypothetical protein